MLLTGSHINKYINHKLSALLKSQSPSSLSSLVSLLRPPSRWRFRFRSSLFAVSFHHVHGKPSQEQHELQPELIHGIFQKRHVKVNGKRHRRRQNKRPFLRLPRHPQHQIPDNLHRGDDSRKLKAVRFVASKFVRNLKRG